MKWDQMRRSDNVEDQRGNASGGFPGGMGGVGIGGLAIALIGGLILGVNPIEILSLLESNPGTSSQPESQPLNDRDSNFVRAVLGDTEDTWSRIFQTQVQEPYQPPRLVLFNGFVTSACGSAQTTSGPFYCPADEKVYLDMNFFRQVRAAAGPDADFARAYAIAHEVGHHIQNELGIFRQSPAFTISG